MHPPFFTVDHKIGPDIQHSAETRQLFRRHAPEILALNHAAPGWPPVPMLPTPLRDDAVPQSPTGTAVISRMQLRVVPPPQRSVRDIVGRWLIRMGQRMILENRLG